ncbi:helix-turn-helix transcriptional regulator [Polaribacter sp.]|uniref:helix-turn-helix transcriptional regulator n=1 Tax=Polaribacter sp. TaxID=1920175 RepID=UPI004047CB65
MKLQVILELSKVNSNKTIALNLEISIKKIKYHIKNICDKLQVHSKEYAKRKASIRKFI